MLWCGHCRCNVTSSPLITPIFQADNSKPQVWEVALPVPSDAIWGWQRAILDVSREEIRREGVGCDVMATQPPTMSTTVPTQAPIMASPTERWVGQETWERNQQGATNKPAWVWQFGLDHCYIICIRSCYILCRTSINHKGRVPNF